MKKICTQCHSEKPLDSFSKDKRQRLGRRPECKTCEHKRPSYLYKRLQARLSYLPKYYGHVKNELTVEDIAEMERVCYFCSKPIPDGACLHRIDHKGNYSKQNTVMVHKTCHARFGGHQKGRHYNKV